MPTGSIARPPVAGNPAGFRRPVRLGFADQGRVEKRRVRAVAPDQSTSDDASFDFFMQYDTDVVLRDGSTLHLRPVRPEDRARIVEFYRRLSNESLYFRFFTVPKLEGPKLDTLLAVDYENQFALVGDLRERIVAVAGYSRVASRPERAEVAFAIADELQGRGVGTRLLERLAGGAREQGFTRFAAA